MKLRDYQEKAIDSVFEEWKEVTSTLIILPTGTGKSRIAAGVIERVQPKRTLFLAHREELIFQAKQQIEKATGIHCEIEMGEIHSTTNLFSRDSVIISTIQTQMTGRMEKFNPNEFGYLICDEAHHFCAPSFRKVLDYYKRNENLRILGMTATPDRADEKALGQVFDSVADEYEILDAIENGWLVNIEQEYVGVSGLDYSGIRTTCGDLNGGDLAKVLEEEETAQGMVGAAIEVIDGKQAIMFCESVKQAEQAGEIFNRHRSDMATFVSGAMNKEERRKNIKAFREGKIQVLCNCMVATEGFDAPNASVIIMGRPTKSRSLYAQMIGRGTRPLTGLLDGVDCPEERKRLIAESEKPSVLVLDFAGNSGRHKLVSAADILGGNVSDEAIEMADRKARESGGRVDVSKALEESQEEIRKKIEESKRREAARKARLVAKAQYERRSINPFDVLGIQPMRERGWDRGKKLSEKQAALLEKQGIKPDSVSYSQGKQLIGEIIKRFNTEKCSFKQAKLLTKYGYDPDVTRNEANAIINALANNGWRKPETVAADIDCPF